MCVEQPPTTSRASTNIDVPDADDDSARTLVPNVVFWTDLAGNLEVSWCFCFLKVSWCKLPTSHYTNEQNKTAKYHPSNKHEIMKLFEFFFVMSYRRLPSINHYWSTHPSMGNQLLKTAFSRDRFKLLMSKFYMNYHDKPNEAGKLYYVKDLINYLKLTFWK